MRRYSKFAGAFVALGLLMSTTTAGAQEMTLALPGPGVLHAAEFIADEKGFWKAHGLDVTATMIPGPGALNALLAGSVDVTIASPGSLFVVLSRGQSLEAIGNTFNQLPSQVVLRKDVVEQLNVSSSADFEARVNALKGLSLGVDSINGIAHSALRYLAGQSDLDAEVDLVISPIQPPSMPAALQTKRIDGFLSAAPWTSLAVKQGEAVLWIEFGEETPEIHPFAANVIVVRGGWCEENEGSCEKYLAGINDALQFIIDEPEAAYELVRGRAGVGVDPEIMTQTWAAARPMFAETSLVEEASLKYVEDFAVQGGMIDENQRLGDDDWDAVIRNEFNQ